MVAQDTPDLGKVMSRVQMGGWIRQRDPYCTERDGRGRAGVGHWAERGCVEPVIMSRHALCLELPQKPQVVREEALPLARNPLRERLFVSS